MGRPRTFDEDAALLRAMNTFWSRGIGGTSVRDLCAALDIGAGSFYAAFGSKTELFERALGRYLEEMRLPPPGEAAIAAYFERVIADREPRGCLLALSAAEVGQLEPGGRRLVEIGLAGLEAFFARCLGDRPTARVDAALLSSAVWGLQLRHRAGEGPDALRPTVTRLLSALDIPAEPYS